jgi:hypothetical protein
MSTQSTVRLVLTNRFGVVHDLNTSRYCPEVSKLTRELSEGRGCYVSVKAVEAFAHKIPGCGQCFGSTGHFEEYIRSN